MACCSSRPGVARTAKARPGLQQSASGSSPPAPGGRQLAVRPPRQQQRAVAAGAGNGGGGGGSADDSGSEADSFYSADEVFHWSGAAGSEQEGGLGGTSSDDPGGDVARVQALLSSMSPDSVAAQGWERAASWSCDAGTACAYRKPATDDTGVFIFFFEGTKG